MDDLKACDPLLPPAADTAGALEVVPVHDDVNGQVQCDDNPGYGGATEELSVAENSSGAMVVAVEEGYKARMISKIASTGVVEDGKECTYSEASS